MSTDFCNHRLFDSDELIWTLLDIWSTCGFDWIELGFFEHFRWVGSGVSNQCRDRVLGTLHIRINPKAIEIFPETRERLVGVAIEVATGNAPERPSRSFELPLATDVIVISFGAVPPVPIAFDCHAAPQAFDHQVDTITADFDLWQHSIPALANTRVDLLLEHALEWGDKLVTGIRRQLKGLRLDMRSETIFEQFPSHVIGVGKIVQGHAMEEPELIPGAACRDIEPTFGRLSCLGRFRSASVFHRSDDQAQEDDITFVTLEIVRPPTDEAAPIDLFRRERIEYQFADRTLLTSTQQADDAHGLAVVARIGATRHDLPHDRLCLRFVRVRRRFIAVWDMSSQHRLEPVGSILPQRDEGTIRVREIVGELNDFRHTPEVFSKLYSA